MLTVDQYEYVRTAHRVYGKKSEKLPEKQAIQKTQLKR